MSLSGQVVHAVSDVRRVQSHGGNRQRVPLERVRSCVGAGDVRAEGKGNPEGRRQHGLCCHFQFLEFCLLQPLGLGSPVLEPDLDLGLRQVEGTGELRALGNGEVLLLAELPLQREQLRRGEGGPGLSVRLVFSQGAGGGTQPSCDETTRVRLKHRITTRNAQSVRDKSPEYIQSSHSLILNTLTVNKCPRRS